MNEQPNAEPIITSTHIHYPTVLSYDPIDVRRIHFRPIEECPFCGEQGQYMPMIGKKYANYCKGCGITIQL
jgi:hypothetical protein